MRRTSVFLALAAIILTALVGFTYWLRLSKSKPHHSEPLQVGVKYDAQAKRGWVRQKDDPVTNRPIYIVNAGSFQGTKDPSTFELKVLSLRLYSKDAAKYTLVKSDSALFDERSGLMRSDGPVTVVMSVPSDVAPNDNDKLSKYVHVNTTGVVYETKSGKASTDQLATFVFPQGGGHAVGAEYDPNTRILHLKSAVSLDWIGSGPPENKVHVETSDLVYKELEQKVYLSPWSKMQRQTLTILAKSSVVTLDDGHLHQIDSVDAAGTDDRNGRLVQYSAANMIAKFNEDGAVNEIIGDKDAHITSTETAAKIIVTGDHADLNFDVDTQMVANKQTSDSNLHSVVADGHAVAISQPLPVPGVQQADTRILRSEHILLTMRPGGQEVQEISAPTKASLEFKPNRPGLPHRFLDASKLRVLYGDNSYVESFTASNVKTRTDKPAGSVKTADGKPPAPAFTWSDEMFAKFKLGSNEIATIDQNGHFRYQEGDRKASSDRAQLLQDINRITLTDKARVLDANGSTTADVIVMNQTTGDMDATGHVRSTHAPDKNEKPGTSMLDATKSMEAQADKMISRDNNTKVSYTGHAILWQGANRISADSIDIDRDDESLHACGDVVSELVDNKSTPGSNADNSPLFTTVRAPDLVYHDDTRLALYTGGVKLTREKMIVTSDRMQAILTPKTDDNKDQSSLDHAISDGDVKVFETVAGNRTRTGTSEHGEYFTKDDKVVLTGGSPQFVDSQKGITRGKQLTYFSSDDKLIVEGEPAEQAFTRLKKR
jgi:lipopolysaccharide export system protein LptA